MPKKTDGTERGIKAFTSVGLQAGGYSGKMDLTPTGHLILSTDESGVACYKNPGDAEWKQLFRYGDNLPEAEAVWKGAAEHAYGVARSYSNPSVMLSCMYGKVYRTTTGAEPSSPGAGDAWTKITAYKGGNPDPLLHHNPDFAARLYGTPFRIDPVNPLIFVMSNPVDGGYVSIDGGVTLPAISSLPAPANTGNERFGVNFAFDASTASGGKTQAVYACVAGRQCYRSTTGANGTWAAIGGPTKCTDICASQGVLWVCDENQKLWRFKAGVWKKMVTATSGGTDVLACSVDVRPSDPANQLITYRQGGAWFRTVDGGETWDTQDNPFAVGSGSPSWPRVANTAYLSVGLVRWDERAGVNQLALSFGLGFAELDNPPQTNPALKWRMNSLGILELIPTLMQFTAAGDLNIVCHDRAFWNFKKGAMQRDATGHGPDYVEAITHGTNVQECPNVPDFVMASRTNGGGGYVQNSLWKNARGGALGQWLPVNDGGDKFGGNILPLSLTNYIWHPALSRPVYTTNGGTTWLFPVFKLPNGTVIDMSASQFGSYFLKRETLIPIEGSPASALLFIGNGNSSECVGVWRTDDGGATWVRLIALPSFLGGYHVKLRAVKGRSNCYFLTPGDISGPTNPAGGLYPAGPAVLFTSDMFQTTTLLSDLSEGTDIQVGPSDTDSSGARTNPFGWVYQAGWRDVGGTLRYGVWVSKDFNPNSPLSATYIRDVAFPAGRSDSNTHLAVDPSAPGHYAYATPAGGVFDRELAFKAKAV